MTPFRISSDFSNAFMSQGNFGHRKIVHKGSVWCHHGKRKTVLYFLRGLKVLKPPKPVMYGSVSEAFEAERKNSRMSQAR